MKKYLFIALFYFLSPPLHSQLMQKDNQCNGFGKFTLGKPTAAFGDNISFAAKYTRDNHEFKVYSYIRTPGEPVGIENINFHSILMTFNDSDKLIAFTFIKFYKKADSPKYEKEAKSDFRVLTDYIGGELKTEAENKLYYKSSKWQENGKEWSGKNGLLKVSQKYAGNNAVIECSFTAGN